MVETCVGPSELHLKKELTTLRKARFLRDPETCSSWRSPLSSRSVAATSILNCENGAGGNSKGVLNSGGLLELPSRSDNKWNKVYLYNWRYHSSKSSDSGIKLDAENMQGSVDGSPEDSLCIPRKKNSKDKTSLEAPVNVYSVRSNNPEIPVRRIVRKPRRNAMSRKRVIKHSAALRLLDLKSRSLAFNSVEHDDTEHSNSEDLQRSAYGPTQKTGYLSRSASPMFSRSGCGSWSCSSKMLRNFRREESSPSHTPASTSSYNRYGARNPSNVGSWDDTTASFDGDELDQLELPGRQGCGIPCYWSKRTKDRGFGGWSPSLSDTLKRKGSSILCGSQTRYHKKRLSSICMQKYVSKSSQGVPLLTNSCDGGGSSLDTVSDELSTNFGEIELEALSRLDGKRWSSCKSQEGMELALPEETAVEVPDHRNLSQKYRPSSFEDIIGQAIVVQSLHNAISRGRIAPAYLFQGPRGTGKTSTARIFAAALNCLSTEENKPCGFCRECAEFSSGNGPNVREVEATNQKGMDRIRYFLKCMTVATTFSQYKVFVIDECHLVSSKMWSAFMKHLEEPPPRVVFIFITIDPDNLPRTIVSRCQKYLFPKIKDIDIISRLRKISAEESLDVDLEALDLIALNSDGSLRDAETMLDQLSLLGKKITTSLVNDLIGVVSDEKLLDLLEIAMSSDTAETVKRSRELMDSGVDPMALMSQLAGLIMDIIAGTYQIAHSQPSSTVLGGRSLTESELERLQRALKILSDAEKQLRLSSERSTWFTAALLQLGTGHNLEPNRSSSSSKHSTGKMNGGDLAKETSFNEKNTHPSLTLQESNSIFVSRLTSGCSSPHGGPASHRRPLSEKSSDALPANSQSVDNSLLAGTLTDDANGKRVISCPDKLADIWRKCIERCHSKTLRQLLCAHGRLVSITETEFAGTLIAFIAFGDANIKSRVERFLSSITNSIEIVLKQNVEVRIGFLPENCMKKHSESPDRKHRDEGFLDKERKVSYGNVNGSADKERKKEKSLDYSDIMLEKAQEKCDNSLVADEGCQVASNTVFSSETNHVSDINNNTAEEIPIQRMHAAVIDEQRLESAWLQVAEKGTAGLVNLKLEKNQAFPHNGVSYQNQSRSLKASSMSSKHWEDELNCEIRTLRISDAQGHHEKLTKGRLNHLAISPSLLHSNSLATNFDKDNLGYESGPGCNGLFCWNTRKPCRGKVKQATHGRSQKTGRLSLFGQCGKLKTP